ncbi:hypothetical protein IPL68_00430 [Candidatus Saccharibacteria bacterium]|nr:MAG: hypothetical protein IPL68_00430 [Candidatus Saccharibacteria bacterium]
MFEKPAGKCGDSCKGFAEWCFAEEVVKQLLAHPKDARKLKRAESRRGCAKSKTTVSVSLLHKKHMQVVVQDIVTQYRRSGKGKSVLLLHGWGDTRASWSSAMQLLAKTTM